MEVERPDQGSHISLPLTDNSAAYLTPPYLDTTKQPTSMRSSCIFLQCYYYHWKEITYEGYVTPPSALLPSLYRYLEHTYYETFNLNHSFSDSFLILAYINPRRPIYLHVLLFPFRGTCITYTLGVVSCVCLQHAKPTSLPVWTSIDYELDAWLPLCFVSIWMSQGNTLYIPLADCLDSGIVGSFGGVWVV